MRLTAWFAIGLKKALNYSAWKLSKNGMEASERRGERMGERREDNLTKTICCSLEKLISHLLYQVGFKPIEKWIQE